MISILKKNQDGTVGVVCQTEMKVGDGVILGYNSNGQPITKAITEIHEQRKERGVYEDEANRRMWAKVSIEK